MSSLSRHVSCDVTEYGNVTNVLDKVKNRHVSIILRHDQCVKTMKFTRKNAFNPWVHTRPPFRDKERTRIVQWLQLHGEIDAIRC